MNAILTSIRMILAMTLVTGLAYPLAVTLPAQLLFGAQAEGSLLKRDGKALGSSLLAQKTQADRYFWPRPSACDYNASASSGSNLGPTSVKLRAAVDERRAVLLKAHPGSTAVPEDLLYASGSGLDPHISPGSARWQASRVAAARKLDPAKVLALVEAHVEGPQFGLLGEPRVNVLALNLALDGAR